MWEKVRVGILLSHKTCVKSLANIKLECPYDFKNLGAHFLHWNQNSKFWVTWPRIAQSVYFLVETCLFFNLCLIKFTIMGFFDIHTWNFSFKALYMSKPQFLQKIYKLSKTKSFLRNCVFFDMLRTLVEKFNAWMSKKHNCEFYHSRIENKRISLKKYKDWAILGHLTQNLEFLSQCRKCASGRILKPIQNMIDGIRNTINFHQSDDNKRATVCNILKLTCLPLVYTILS